ncbi:MAG TPA: CDP-alcohol phosphatidyltransferase family protein, partial [Methyloceanibacter sp.]|nr:CDP-alcohol phosphatidyltransferase family protein [Methyloceanibacter sp.]
MTASGAVLALLALRAVHQGDWKMMFVWLGVALLVDAVDGPLARALKVETRASRISGERLDLIVDYLTYVAVPAFALTEATLLPEAARLPAAAAMLVSGLFHVADLTSKTEEG